MGRGAQIAAAGHGHLCLAKAGEQRTQEVVAGTHLAGQIVRDVGAVQVGGVDLVGIAVQHLDAGTQGAQGSFRLTATSLMSGRFSITQTSAARMVAGRMPTAAFFAPEMVTSPCRGLPPVITNFSNFIISLSQARQRQGHSGFLLDLSAHRWAHTPSRYNYLIIHNFGQKAKPLFPCRIIFCFAQNLRRYSTFLFLISKILQSAPLTRRNPRCKSP